MRTIATLIIIVLGVLPALFAGLPQIAPGWFDPRVLGAPAGVLAMCALLVAFVLIAALCSAAARSAAARSDNGAGQ